MLSEGLQAYKQRTTWNQGFPEVPPRVPASKYLLTYKTPFKPKGRHLWAESPPRWYLSGFPTGRKHVPSCTEWLMRSVLIFVSQVINLLRSRGSGVTIKQPLKVETAGISATANEWSLTGVWIPYALLNQNLNSRQLLKDTNMISEPLNTFQIYPLNTENF